MTEAVVHLIDDDEAVRDSLSFLLTTAGMVSRTYESAVTFLEQLADAAPGCVVTDIRMPDMNGLELVRRLKERGARHPIIVITGHGDVPLAVEAMKAGVVDFLEKPFDDEALLGSIRAALAIGGQATQASEERRKFEAMLAALSPRETEVLKGVLAGKQNKVIAFELGISARTVEVYRANVMTKTSAGSLSELVRLALLAGGL
ncbi:response regulator FixJ [Phenylobacterium sp. LH3H17]|uniref:response regulator FixJ n=1 Tax=Phenylobacterium sp. LH3H17 TaxID=2903901 RepID=UPI0020C9FCB8|nr:response regulator FixJ [Phenylobacterium sp. LH3H17]UTP41566.1 response regulator FixJ [Phenylobacterium sp. LH3H17]